VTQLAQRFEPGVIRFDKKLPDLAASAGPAHGLRQIDLIREGAQQNLKQGLDLAIRPGVASPVAPTRGLDHDAPACARAACPGRPRSAPVAVARKKRCMISARASSETEG
jgi:hypothetical protein